MKQINVHVNVKPFRRKKVMFYYIICNICRLLKCNKIKMHFGHEQ